MWSTLFVNIEKHGKQYIMVFEQSQCWIYALLSAFFAALTTILAKVGVQHVSLTLATAVRTIIILVVAWAIVFARGEGDQLSTLSLRTLIFLGLSGLATGLSWIFYFPC